jgi:transposase
VEYYLSGLSIVQVARLAQRDSSTVHRFLATHDGVLRAPGRAPHPLTPEAVREAHEHYLAREGRQPSEAELAAELGVGRSIVRTRLRKLGLRTYGKPGRKPTRTSDATDNT